MNEAKVSVIVPVYNGEAYVAHCVKMLLDQTYQNLEIVLVNDGSKDRTAEIIAGLSDPRLVVVTQENAGVSTARNVALARATGDLVVCVDVDDDVEPTYLEKLVGTMAEPEVMMGICGFAICDREHPEKRRNSTFAEGCVTMEQAVDTILRFRQYNPSIWNKIFRMERIRQCQLTFNTEITLGEDMLFLVQYCLAGGQCRVLPDPLYIYYESAAGAMFAHKNSTAFQKKWLSEWTAICAVEKGISEKGWQVPAVKVKKVRIAEKLVGLMNKYHETKSPIYRELLACVKEARWWCLKEPDYDAAKRRSIFMNSWSPALWNRIKSLKK